MPVQNILKEVTIIGVGGAFYLKKNMTKYMIGKYSNYDIIATNWIPASHDSLIAHAINIICRWQGTSTVIGTSINGVRISSENLFVCSVERIGAQIAITKRRLGRCCPANQLSITVSEDGISSTPPMLE